MSASQAADTAKRIERLREMQAGVAERKRRHDDLCLAVKKAVNVWTSPRKSNNRSQPSPTVIKSIKLTSRGLEIEAEESEKGSGVKIALTLHKDGIGSVVELFLNGSMD